MLCRTTSIRARVDWIDVEIQTTRATNFQTVQRAFDSALQLAKDTHVHVTAISPNSGGGATRFVVRLHDIARHADLLHIVLDAGRHVPINEKFKLTAIEVAVDAYGPDPAALTARRFQYLERPTSQNRRIFRTDSDITQAIPAKPAQFERALREGWQIGIGNKTDDLYMHGYAKDTDTRNSERVRIEPCSRFEIRANRVGLTVLKIEPDVMTFKFEKLAPYFAIQRPRDDLSPLERVHVERTTHAFGERKIRNRNEGGTRLSSKLTTTDLEFNKQVRAALRGLSKRWQSTSNRGRRSGSGQKSACENSVRVPSVSLGLESEKQGDSDNYTSQDMLALGDSQPSLPTRASVASAARLHSTPSESIEASVPSQATDGGMRPLPASPSPTAPAIPVTSTTHDNVIKSVPTEPRRGNGWKYPDEPW